MRGVARKDATPSQRYWATVLSFCFSALGIATAIGIQSLYDTLSIPMANVTFTLVSYICPLLTLSSALASVYLTRNVAWWKGRLLSIIALGCGIVSIGIAGWLISVKFY